MSNEFENDIVFARFINYMEKALLHRKINYNKHQDYLKKREVCLKEEEWVHIPDNGNEAHSFFALIENNQNERTVRLKKFMEKLTEKQKRVLYMSYVEKKTAKTIADTMNVSEKAIEQLKSRAIKRLRKYMKEEL